MKYKITFLFLFAGIIIYALTLATASISNFILLIMCISMFVMIRKKFVRINNFISSNEELRRIVDSIPISVLIKDIEGNVIIANNEFYKEFQLSNEITCVEITERIYSLFDKKTILQEEKILFSDNTVINCERFIRKNNKITKFYIRKTGIYDDNKRLKNIIVFIKNIETNEFDCSNEDLIATLTHDLKTPAVAQMRGIELLLNGYFGEINDRQRNFLTDIWQSGNYMLSMLVDMLWLYKFDNKKIALNVVSFNVNDLIKEILKENKLTLNIKNSDFVQNNKTAKIHILADKSHIKRIIHNILMNAVTHSTEGSMIYINTDIKSNEFVFQVTNQGKYIPPEMLKCLLDRNSIFNQKCDGLSTGLGLYLSNSLLELNGGKFICESTKEGKNTFGFVIKLGGSCYEKINNETFKTKL
ncbi:hypothetical protein IJD44_00135 [bacterium]|nr:hypothetical protein [bacterium]